MLYDQLKPNSSDNVAQQGMQPLKNSSHNKRHTFEALKTAFLHSLQSQGYSGTTVDSYAQDLSIFGKWLKKQNLAILELCDEDLQRYKSWTYTNKQKRPATVNRYLATLRRFYRWAHRIGYLHTPLQVPKCLPHTPSCIRWLTAHQQRQLIRTIKRQHSIRDRAIIFILLHTGLRASELCALQWKDIHMTERSGSLCIRQAKGQRERTLPLNTKARAAIHQLGYERNAGKKKHVLRGQRGPLVSRSLQRIVGKYGKQAGLTALSPHSLRHTFCKNLINAQIGLETAACLAGHVRIETTERYCKPSWQDLERAVAALAK